MQKSTQIILEFAEEILLPKETHIYEAMSVALLLVQTAWNCEIENLPHHDISRYQNALREIEVKYPPLWSQFISPDPDTLVQKLRQHKKNNYPAEQKLLLLTAVTPEGKIIAEWGD